MELDWISVTSSNLDSVAYDPATSSLWVRFLGGDVYEYFGVPKSVFQQLVVAASIGKFLNAEVKPYYNYRKY